MHRTIRGIGISRLAAIVLLVTFLAAGATQHALAQATITGTVTSANGRLPGAQVLIRSLDVSTTADEVGQYRLMVPSARVRGRSLTVTMTARLIGYRSASAEVTVANGSEITRDFTLEGDPFLLEGVVVTGQGLQKQRTKIGSTINTVRAEEIQASQEQNVIHALAAKAPNVEVTSSTGDPGGGAYIRIRGTKSIEGGTQPLIVVDGTPITNASNTIDEPIWGTAYQNRAADINPEDVESIEILKGAAAASIYGSRASNGVILITTKSGQRNSTQVTLKTSTSSERVTQLPALQTRFRQGLDLTHVGGSGTVPSSVSWGEALDPDTPVFNHAGELFETGLRVDNTLTLSGGSSRTTYYLSLGYLYHDGTIIGNSDYRRFTSRLKGSHDLADNFTVSGNVAYTTSANDLIQQGSNVSGLLLGAFRTPPEFNNCLPEADPCYTHPETGLHRSYRNPNPTTLAESRGFDNPFWVANELDNTADVDRVTANINVDYAPLSWLSVRYLLGGDFANDQRTSVFPKGSSEFAALGYLIRAELVDQIFDQSILVTFDRSFSDALSASLTVGHNLNQTKFRRFQVDGFDLIDQTAQLEFTVEQFPNEFESTVKTEGYFAEGTIDLFDQVFLKGGLRYDGSNTFGGDTTETGKREPSRFWYPTASAVWEFGRHVSFLSFAKVRAAWGEAGVQPPAFSNVNSFEDFGPGSYGGFEAVASEGTLGNRKIEPERTREWELGGELALLDNRLSLDVTRYWQRTRNAIVRVPVSPSTGFSDTFANGASWRNWGWEVTLTAIPVKETNFSWQLSGHWAKNDSKVDTLSGAETIFLDGFQSASARAVQGQPFPVLFGDDFLRFGRGSSVGGVNIDEAYPEAEPGTLYICGGPPECEFAGFPLLDPQERVIGDPNPHWTGSIRSTFTFFDRVRLSGLIDIKHGGEMWNGTKGALFFYGTHKETERMHGGGLDTVFVGAGPGAGTPVNLNWRTWTLAGIGSGFTGPVSLFVEDAGFVKLRDVSLSFTLDSRWLGKIGFNTLTVALSGRNLATWTNYTGLDPESNLTGQSTGRGLEYFNHPQTRSVVFTLTLQR